MMKAARRSFLRNYDVNFCDSTCKQEKVYLNFASAAVDTLSSKGSLVEKGTTGKRSRE